MDDITVVSIAQVLEKKIAFGFDLIKKWRQEFVLAPLSFSDLVKQLVTQSLGRSRFRKQEERVGGLHSV